MVKFAPKYKSVYVDLIPEIYKIDKEVTDQIKLPEDYRFGVFTFSSQNKNPNQRLRKVSADAKTDSR